ncbi:MFS transporter [Nocardiopsis sp. EMB25]|uniref:MFS transporter n=1 Tax=Nocardiopsis sp. EMB25 TaxID=2835867 RepID=UPI002283A156|nr:MFS transporter [Nocardiopsis sp. EMB25]MCY9786950.1 MFS transporter [Nocardiopsis sp. EMB25]
MTTEPTSQSNQNQAPGPPPPAPDPGISARSTGVRLALLFGPAVFGVTAAGVALPDVSASLGTAPSATAWVLTAHALALGVGTALFGRLSDTLGMRRALVVGAVGLLAGSALCLLAPSLPVLVAGRLVLAAGSGAMSAVALAIAAGSAPDRRPVVLMIFGATMAFFAASATLAGGVVTAALSWRLTLILPALSLIAFPLCLRLAHRPGSGKSVDALGASLLTVGVAAVLILIQAPVLALTTAVGTVVAALAVVSIGLLAYRVAKHADGFVPRSLIANKDFRLAVAIGSGVYAGLFATMYAVPQLLVAEHGWNVLWVGLSLLPGAVVGAVLSRLAGGLGARAGAAFLVAGTAFAATLLLGIGGVLGANAIVLVAGASFALAAFAVTQVVMTGFMSPRIPLPLRGTGMGLLNLTFFVGGAVGSAAAGALAQPLGPSTGLAVVTLAPLAAGLLALLVPTRPQPAG